MHTIIFLLGNRDVQIRNGHPLMKHEVVKKYFIPHNDGEDLIIKKTFDDWFTFEEASADAWQHFDSLREAFRFPLIEASLAALPEKPQKLIFCGTRQQPYPHRQDTWAFAEIATYWYEAEGYETEASFIPVNPNSFEHLTSHFTELFQSYAQASKGLIISNSGGTPNMRAASHFAGIFKGYRFMQVLNGQVATLDFQKQEARILDEIIQRKLHMYDYEGILSLPGLSAEVRKLSKEAIDWYNLSTDLITSQQGYEAQARQAILLIYSNMLVCFRKGGYADAIGRIFRLEEAIGQLLLFNYLTEEGFMTPQGEVLLSHTSDHSPEKLPYKLFLSDRNRKEQFFTHNYPQLFQGDRNGFPIFKQTLTPLRAILNSKNLYFFLFKHVNRYPNVYGLFEKINGQYHRDHNPLANLRNHSMLGHGYKGVSKGDLEAVLGSFDHFIKDLQEAVELEVDLQLVNLFEAQNKKIQAALP